MTTVPGSSISQSSSALEPDEFNMHILCSFCVHSDVYIMNLFTFTLSAVCDEAVGLTGATWCNTWHVATRGNAWHLTGLCWDSWRLSVSPARLCDLEICIGVSSKPCTCIVYIAQSYPCYSHVIHHVIWLNMTPMYRYHRSTIHINSSYWKKFISILPKNSKKFEEIRRNSTSSMVRRAIGSPWVLSRSVVSGSPWLSKISDLVPLWRACAAKSLCLAETRHDGVATRVASMSLLWWNHHLFKWFWDWYGLILGLILN